MKTSIATVTLLAFAGFLGAQETPPPKRTKSETKTAPQQQHTAPQREQPREHAAPPPREQQVQHPTPQREQPREQRPVQQPAPVHERPQNPVQQQTAPREQQRPVQQQTGQPARNDGRTFGNPNGGNPNNANPNGGRTFGRTAGQPVERSVPAAAPRTYTTRGGDVIHRSPSGQVTSVRTSNGTTFYHPPNGPRRVEVVRPNGSTIVASAPGHGYVQRPIIVNNTTVIKRTYVYNGVPQARFYRPVVYSGVTLAVYTPVRYYRPAFYMYAYNPWARPIVYSWGWGGSPWYGYYGGYFTPYPTYYSPSLWLTDYLIAATLESAYQERMAARADARAAAANAYADGGQQAPLTPEVKQQIADEVRRQIDRERAQGQTASSNSGGPDTSIFSDGQSHVFVAHHTQLVTSSAGECPIGEGDVLQMNTPPPPGAMDANLTVLASRGQDCRKGTTVRVPLQDVQEMHNQMLATIDRGLGDLQSKQGQSGMPAMPQGAAGTIDSPLAAQAQPDPNVSTELATVNQEADRAEQQVLSQSNSADAAATPVLTLGLTVDEVKKIQGEPDKIVDLGSKKIYVYKDLKITFTDGKTSDIQ